MDLGLFQHIESNRRKSVLLIVIALLILIGLGAAIGAASGFTPLGGMGIALLIGAILSLVAWNQGAQIVLAAAGAKEIRREEDPELVNVVEEMCLASGLPRPRIYLIPDDAMNAFATGMKPEQGVVAVTRGLRERLKREELQGVVAHEMAHIGNYDTRVMVLMAVIVGSVAILSDFFLRGMRYGGRRRSKGDAALLVIAVVLAILAPILALMVQFAVSRRREYLADATAASMTRNPGALADALEKLATQPTPLRTANRGTQHLYVVNPFRTRQKRNHVFATHPPIQDRIWRLRRLAGTAAAQPPA